MPRALPRSSTDVKAMWCVSSWHCRLCYVFRRLVENKHLLVSREVVMVSFAIVICLWRQYGQISPVVRKNKYYIKIIDDSKNILNITSWLHSLIYPTQLTQLFDRITCLHVTLKKAANGTRLSFYKLLKQWIQYRRWFSIIFMRMNWILNGIILPTAHPYSLIKFNSNCRWLYCQYTCLLLSHCDW